MKSANWLINDSKIKNVRELYLLFIRVVGIAGSCNMIRNHFV